MNSLSIPLALPRWLLKIMRPHLLEEPVQPKGLGIVAKLVNFINYTGSSSSDSGNGGSSDVAAYQINTGLDVYLPSTGWGVDAHVVQAALGKVVKRICLINDFVAVPRPLNAVVTIV